MLTVTVRAVAAAAAFRMWQWKLTYGRFKSSFAWVSDRKRVTSSSLTDL